MLGTSHEPELPPIDLPIELHESDLIEELGHELGPEETTQVGPLPATAKDIKQPIQLTPEMSIPKKRFSPEQALHEAISAYAQSFTGVSHSIDKMVDGQDLYGLRQLMQTYEGLGVTVANESGHTTLQRAASAGTIDRAICQAILDTDQGRDEDFRLAAVGTLDVLVKAIQSAITKLERYQAGTPLPGETPKA